MNDRALRLDALTPPEMAERAEALGVAKAALPASTTFALAVLAGAFIALGSMFATAVAAGGPGAWPWGVHRLFVGVAFSLGLVLVVVGGAELFTGNVLLVMAWRSGRLGAGRVLRNWALVLAGNAVGALGTAGLATVAEFHAFAGGQVGAAAIAAADAKCALGFPRALALGVLCNALVCLAVWMNLSARTSADRVLVTIPPIAAFVTCGFEHSVANLFAVPAALFARAADAAGADAPHLSWGAFLVDNLLPVTLGNVIGGGVLVAVVYQFVYLRRR
ncbi:MAG: formate/nitrite transporter family protein [Planctomycetota bacterium]